MPVQKRLSQISLAKQSAKGSAASAGTYQMGVSGGQIVNADVSQEAVPVTWSNRLTEANDRISVMPMAEFDFVAMPKTIGLLLYMACGSKAVTGSGPYTHTFKSATDLPYATLFGTFGAEFFKMIDAKVDSLELSWEKTGALKGKVKIDGCDFSWPGSAYTAGTDERPADGLLKGAGGTFTIDGTAAVISSGSIKIENKVEPVFGSAATLPADVFPGLQTVDLSLTVIPADATLWRKILTGAVGGSTIQSTPYNGAAVAKFILDANTDLQFNALSATFASDFPDSDPDGGPAEVSLEASIVVPSGGGDAYSFVLRNGIASY